jgi:integrase
LELVGMSAPQLKRWRTPRDMAVACFIAVIGGDRPVEAISRPDVLKFKTHWQQRVKDGAVRISTANKNIRHVATMFNAVDEHHQLELDDVFRKTRFKGGEDGQRVAFDPAFVQSHFLAEGMFDNINAEARCLIYLICETGLRLSEACNLLEHRIILDAEIPHVQIRPDIAKLKTKASLRDVPLVGVALMAMQANPKGFPRYRLKADALSAWANYVLDQRKLRPVEGQSLYSLRHTFQDRLDGAKIHEATSRQLMGHAKKGVKYGQGVSLDVKLEALKSIAFTPPSRV